ncbi:MAG: PadR family transcriptional regulator [Thermoprotei archaeon]
MQKNTGEHSEQSFIEPQGAPRGLLTYYVLHKLSTKPAYGYEILRDIENKSGGAWRPGPSSIYPLLKKLESAGLIHASGVEGDGSPHRVYSITQKGETHLAEIRRRFAQAGQKWESVGRIFVELVDPADVPSMISRASTTRFELTRQLVESKIDTLPKPELRYALEQYRLGLKRQLEWVEELMSKLGEPNTGRGVKSV